MAVERREANVFHVVDLGSGDSTKLLKAALNRPRKRFIAVDSNKEKMVKAIEARDARGLKNLQVVHGDAVEVLQQIASSGAKAREITLDLPDRLLKKFEQVLVHSAAILSSRGRLVVTRATELGSPLLKAAERAGFSYCKRGKLNKARTKWHERYIARGLPVFVHVFTLK